jgi:putative transposase
MYGLPEVVYIDNGKDWISRHIELVALSFNIKLERHEPYHPQSKGKIERLFRTLEEMCIHPLDGSVGSNTRTRPKKVTPKLPMEQVRVHIERFIRDYHERVHGSTKQKPRDRWEKDLHNHQVVQDLTKIDHLLKSKQYKVQPSGIHFQKRYYRNPEGALGKYIGRHVTVFFDTRNPSRIRVWGSNNPDEEPQYICTAYPQSLAPTLSERAAVAEKNKERRDATRQEVREVQVEGESALKALDDLDGKSAEVDETSAQATPPTPVQPMPTPALSPTTPPRGTHKPLQSVEEDDEPDYEELRRQMQRRERQGGSV